MPNYVTDGDKLYVTANGQKQLVRFTGINWSGMENVEGVPHGLARGQSNLVRTQKQTNGSSRRRYKIAHVVFCVPR